MQHPTSNPTRLITHSRVAHPTPTQPSPSPTPTTGNPPKWPPPPKTSAKYEPPPPKEKDPPANTAPPPPSQRLKEALWFSIGQIVDEESLRWNRNATPQFIGALTELVWTQIGISP